MARKVTIFQPCVHHIGWLAGMTRRRTAECWVEGGPGYGPACHPQQTCAIKPGTDFFGESSLAEVETIAKTWAVNRQPATT